MENNKPKKGILEAEISKALTQWEKEYLGRGSVQVKTDIYRNIILVQLKGILTPAELKLTETKEGMLSVKKNRSDLIESANEDLKEMMHQLTGIHVTSFHTDISTKTGERVIVFTLEENLESQLTP